MNIYVVCVLYKPDKNLLYKTLDSLYKQVQGFFFVVNGKEEYDFSAYNNVEQIILGDNFGIAYAQNRGIERALDINADYVLLSDQDTIYPENYIKAFTPYLEKNSADVFCPVFYDNNKKVFSPIMIKKFKSTKKCEEPIFVEHAIASGTLIKSNIFEKTGLMNENLFIDYVDFEWCWRVTTNGFKILTIPNIIINHQLGDGVKKIGLWNVTLRSDFRYFYILRNGFYLSFYCKNLNKYEKIQLFLRTVKFCIGIILLKKNKAGLQLCKKAFIDAKKKNFSDYS